MTSQDRVIRSLNFQKPDRVAVFSSFWEEFVDNWHEAKGVPPGTDIRDYYGIDISIATADETLFPSRKRVLKKRGQHTVSSDGWGRTVRKRDGAYFYETVDSVLKRKSDLDRLSFDPPDLASRYKNFLTCVAKEKETRCVFCKIGGPFIRSSFVRGETEFLMDLAADKSFARALVERIGNHLLQIALESLRRGGLYDTGVWIYDDMAANDKPMFSPATFEDVFLPMYRRIVARIREAGAAKIILHSDGNIRPLLGMLIDAGFDGINPVEPKAGMDILALRREYGTKLSLIGGLDNVFVLASGDEKRIRDHVVPILKEAGDGGIVVGTHSVGPDISVKAYEFCHSLILKHGTFQVQ